MTRIRLCIAAFLLHFYLLAAPAAQAQIMARVLEPGPAMMVLGLIGTGSEPQMTAFERDAKVAGYITAPAKGRQGEPDIMIILRRADDPSAFWKFYREAIAGKYGTLTIEVVLIPTEYDPAAPDYFDHAKVFPSKSIEPAN